MGSTDMSNAKQATPTAGLGAFVNDALAQALYQASLAATSCGRKPEPPRIMIRKDRLTDGEPTCYAVFRKIVKSLGLPASRIDEAREMLSTTILAVEASARGILAPRQVEVDMVLAWYRDQKGLMPEANRHRRRARQTLITRTAKLIQRLAGKTLGDLDAATVARYIKARMRDTHGAYSKAEDAPRVSFTTACDDIGHLRLAVKAYCAHFQIPWVPVIVVPPHAIRREFLVDRHHFARMLEACRGYVWDPAANAWLTEEVVDPETGETRRVRVRRRPDTVEHRKAVSRLLRIAMYSGTRHGAILGLKWRMNAHGGCIDLPGNVIHRAGYGYAPEEGKPQLSSAMRAQLAILMWIWFRKDLLTGATHVVHKLDGTRFNCLLSGTVREVMADAGVPQACAHSLRHAAITWMMHDGYDVSTVADVIGVAEKTVWKVYRQWNLKSQQRAVGVCRLPVAKAWAADRLDPVLDRDTGAAAFGSRRSFRSKVAVLQRPPVGRGVRKPARYRKVG